MYVLLSSHIKKEKKKNKFEFTYPELSCHIPKILLWNSKHTQCTFNRIWLGVCTETNKHKHTHTQQEKAMPLVCAAHV